PEAPVLPQPVAPQAAQTATVGGAGTRGAANSNIPPAARTVPGLTESTLKGGYTFAIMVGDIDTAETHEVWHNNPTPVEGEMLTNGLFDGLQDVRWAGDDTFIISGSRAGGGGGGRGARGGAGPSGVVPTG